MQPRDHLPRGQRGSGGSTFCFPPGGFAPLSTRESGSLLQINPAWKKMHIHINNFRICGANLYCLLTFDLQLGIRAASSFSILRKKQRGPEGVSDLCPMTATPSGLPTPPHGRLCPELSFPHGPRGGVPFRRGSFVCRCAAPLRRRGAAGTTRSFAADGWV